MLFNSHNGQMKFLFKRIKGAFLLLVFAGSGTFVSCYKAAPEPYNIPEADVTRTVTPTYTTAPIPPDTTPSFLASVNGSSIITFTPGKNTSGSNTTLKGTSASYTITLTFPSSTGPGNNYEIGGSGAISALLVNGSSHYVAEGFYGGGFFTIDSISAKGKYYGTFNFSALDTITNNFIDVTQGSFFHL
jgi:hypothetical protein